MRFAAYAGTSVVLATGVVIRALHERANFYSATVYLAQSNACVFILTNLIFLMLGAALVGLQRLLYGPLRPIELEQLYERTWISLTETCLAMTIFREEVGFWFIVLFSSLLVGKIWGWISEGRVDILEQQPPTNPRLFHMRLSASLALSFMFDLHMLYYTVSTVRQQARPNMMVMFAFEFAVLTVVSLSTCARYALSLQEQAVIQRQTAQKLQEQRARIVREREEANREAEQNGEEGPTFPPIEEELNEFEIDVPGWEEKGRWTFYLNIVTDFFKLVLYLTFFCVLCMFYGMPIHIIRDVAYTVQSFYKRITDFVKYRHATRDMNERYPDATAEQIGREETCIICREVMREWQPNADPPMEERLRPKKLPCGHVLHLACLRSWLERQQNCPTCRQNVLEDRPTNTQGNNGGAQGAANNGAAPGVGDAAGQNRNRDQPRRGNRMRFLNLGPLRVGFGAGNMADLQREINQQNADRVDRQANRAQGNPFRRALGLPGPPTSSTTPNITQQLHVIEQQLLRDMNINMLQQEQLRVVRAMQGELARLRIRQSQVPAASGSGLPVPPTLPVPGPAPFPITGAFPNTGVLSLPVGLPNPGAFHNTGAGLSQSAIQGYTSTQNPQVLTNGHPDLPQGVTIPEGWQLMPLERMGQNMNQAQPGLAQPATTFTAASSSGLDNAAGNSAANTATDGPTGESTSRPSGRASNIHNGPSNNVNSTHTDSDSQPVPSASSQVNESTGQLGQVPRAPGQPERASDAPVQATVSAQNQETMPASTSESTSRPQWGTSTSVPQRGSSAGDLSGNSSTAQPNQHDSTNVGDKGKGKAPTIEDAEDEDDS